MSQLCPKGALPSFVFQQRTCSNIMFHKFDNKGVKLEENSKNTLKSTILSRFIPNKRLLIPRKTAIQAFRSSPGLINITSLLVKI